MRDNITITDEDLEEIEAATCAMRNMIQARLDRLDALEAAACLVVETFKRDEEQRCKSGDRRFAIQVLGDVLNRGVAE